MPFDKSWLDRINDPTAKEHIKRIRAAVSDNPCVQLPAESVAFAIEVNVYRNAIGGSVVAMFDRPDIIQALGSRVLRCDYHPANPFLNSEQRALNTLSHWVGDLINGR